MTTLLWIIAFVEVIGGTVFTIYCIREKVWVEKWWHWIVRFIFWFVAWVFDLAMDHLV